MSPVSSESQRALDVVAKIAGRPADIKRVGRRPLICARWPTVRTMRISNRTCMSGTYLPCLLVLW